MSRMSPYKHVGRCRVKALPNKFLKNSMTRQKVFFEYKIRTKTTSSRSSSKGLFWDNQRLEGGGGAAKPLLGKQQERKLKIWHYSIKGSL